MTATLAAGPGYGAGEYESLRLAHRLFKLITAFGRGSLSFSVNHHGHRTQIGWDNRLE